MGTKIKNMIMNLNDISNTTREDLFYNCVKRKLDMSLKVYYNDITRKIEKAYEHFEGLSELKALSKLNKGINK